MNPTAAASQIKRLLADPELQRTLIQQGKKELQKFDTPKSRAEKYLQLCR